jgi:heat shock protein HtpX
MGNTLRTTILLAVLTAVILWFGQLFGGRQGMIVALILAAAMNFFSYWYSDKIVLRMYRAREATQQQVPELYHVVRELAQRAGLPTPRVYLIPQQTPNAFATGRDPEHAVVAVTDGLLQLMGPDELKGVLSHELAHVKGRDILIGSVAATLAGAIMLMASMARFAAFFGGGRRSDEGGGMGILGLIAMSIIAPIAAMIIQMAISRSREYQADKLGARISQNPEGLARALEKLAAHAQQRPMNAHPSTAHMFIVNPLSGSSLQNLFSTHPPIQERIRRLRGGQPAATPPPVPPMPGGDNVDHQLAQGRAFWDRLSGK